MMKILIILSLLLISNKTFAVTFVEPNIKQAYSASSIHFVPPATPTDMCILNGSATFFNDTATTEIYTNQTTTGTNQYFIIKRSAADTGGTSNAMAAVALDSGYAAATATAVYYTANPTVGTAVGTLFVKRALSPASTGLGIPYLELLAEQVQHFAPVVLRGVAEGLAVSFNGQVLPSGLTIGCTFRWIED